MARKGPLEWFGDLFIVLLEAQEAVFELGYGLKVVWGQNLALDDREVDLDLVEPAGMDWSMDKSDSRPGFLESVGRCGTSVRGTIVDDPEDPASGAIGFVRHYVFNESIKGNDTGGGIATAEDFCAMHIPGSEIGQGAPALVFVLDTQRTAGGGRCGRMTAGARLDAGFLVGGDHEIVGTQGFVVPATFIEVEDTSCFLGELGVAGKDPAAVAPGSDGVPIEPTPEGGAADFRYQTGGDDGAADFGDREA